jgi:multiple sugar transport system substrate-binding protein
MEMGRLAAQLAPLNLVPSRGQDAYEFGRLLRLQIEHNMDWGGKVLAVPLLGESLFGVYRSDLISAPRHASALTGRFEKRFHHGLSSNGPSTWQQVAEVADYFAHEPNWTDGENAATPRSSLVPLSDSTDGFDREFNVVAASMVRRSINQEMAANLKELDKNDRFFSYQIDASTGAIAIAGPGFVAAVQFMQQMQAFRPKGASNHPIDAFRSGNAVFALATLADLASLQDKSSAVAGKFGICRVPGSGAAVDPASRKLTTTQEAEGNLIPYLGWGGWVAGVEAQSTQSSAAQDLLLFLSSPPVSQQAVCEPDWASGPMRSTHLENRACWHNYGLTQTETNQLIAALESYYHSTTLNPAYRLRMSNQQQFLQVFNEKVRSAITENKPANDALSEVARAWESLAPDRAARLTEYRHSLGLH